MQMVVQRELQVAARRSGTYWARVIAGGISAIAILQYTGGISEGRRLFFAAVTLAAIVTFYEGMRRGTAAIAKEKREGTLGLLLLTPLTGPELMRGKFGAIALSTFQTSLAAVPVFAASLLFGGVSAGEFVRAMIALAHGLCLVIVLGLATSTNAKDEETPNAPIGFVIAVAGIFSALTWTIPRLRWINPMTPVLEIADGEYGRGPWSFWISMAVWQGLAWLKLRADGRALIEMVQASEEAAFRERAPVRIEDWKDKPGDYVPGRINDAPRWFDGNAMEWYTLRDVGMHVGRWGALIMTIAVAVCVMIFPEAGAVFWFIGFGTLLVSLCVTSAQPIARLHEWGALELLITTPLGERGVLEGHMSALKKLFLWPFVVGIMAAAYLFFRQFGATPDTMVLYLGGYIGAGTCLAAFMTPWIGTFAALKTKSPQRAVWWTVFFVLALPRLCLFFAGDAIYFGVGGSLVKAKVQEEFKRLVSERFSN